MQRLLLVGWLLALMISVSGVAVAATPFDLPSSDQSVTKMVAPFAGDNASRQIATLFGGLNAAILFLGSLVACYGILSSIAQTAHDGEMLGRRFSSLWVPIRVAIGLAAIMPHGNGLCGAQMVVNHVAQMGISAGANIWSQYVANASPDDGDDYVIPDISGMRNLALGIYMSNVCKIGYERYAATDTTGETGIEKEMKLTEILPGQYAYGTLESPTECGGFVIPDYSTGESRIGTAHQQALNILILRMAMLAAQTEDVANRVDKAATDLAITSAVDEYKKTISEAAHLAYRNESGQRRQIAMSASSDGWMMAGAYFASAGRSVATVNSAASNLPKSVPPA
ncbi:MAG: DotA/TraY family protein, partial [Betaproteobacteria bacterium]